MVFFGRHFESLREDPLALAVALLAYAWLPDERLQQQMVECVQSSPHEASVTSFLIQNAITLGDLDKILASTPILDHIRARHREEWIGQLWNLEGDDVALDELKLVAVENMTPLERRFWMFGLLRKREHEAVETLLQSYYDPIIEAGLLHQRGEYAAARAHYEALADSTNGVEQRFGQEGLAKLAEIAAREDASRGHGGR